MQTQASPTISELKAQIQAIIADEFRPPAQIEPYPFAMSLLQHLGSTDADLRDALIYRLMAHWIIDGVLSSAELIELLTALTSEERLFYHIGELEDDGVFLRSFSVLLLAPIVYAHRQKPFLETDLVRELCQTVLRYFAAEQDLRGYVPDKGWAHAVAHASDVLDELAQCEEMRVHDLRQIMLALQAKASAEQAPYVQEEDERMAYATVSLLKRGIVDKMYVKNWIKDFIPLAQLSGELPYSRYRMVNTKHFLRSLYFQGRRQGLPENLCQTMFDALEQINRYH